VERVAKNLGLLLYFFKTETGENNRPIGENSPNLVTLDENTPFVGRFGGWCTVKMLKEIKKNYLVVFAVDDLKHM
jgi:hypothetical protein